MYFAEALISYSFHLQEYLNTPIIPLKREFFAWEDMKGTWTQRR